MKGTLKFVVALASLSGDVSFPRSGVHYLYGTVFGSATGTERGWQNTGEQMELHDHARAWEDFFLADGVRARLDHNDMVAFNETARHRRRRHLPTW